MKTYFQAGIFALLVFLIGIMIGVWLDNYRLSDIRSSISEADINWNDARLLNRQFEILGKDYCDLALKQNIIYNDRIYSEGREIEKKLDSNVFTPDIEQEWRRYNLLQVQFWLNSMELKEKCGFDYHNVVYLSRKKETNTNEEINNRVQSSIMLNLKEICGNKIMLIPLTTDLNLLVINSIKEQYNITNYPAMIIDEKVVFQDLTSLEKLNETVKC